MATIAVYGPIGWWVRGGVEQVAVWWTAGWTNGRRRPRWRWTGQPRPHAVGVGPARLTARRAGSGGARRKTCPIVLYLLIRLAVAPSRTRHGTADARALLVPPPPPSPRLFYPFIILMEKKNSFSRAPIIRVVRRGIRNRITNTCSASRSNGLYITRHRFEEKINAFVLVFSFVFFAGDEIARRNILDRSFRLISNKCLLYVLEMYFI